MDRSTTYTTVLLDIGNVVLGVDFHRVFNHWADSAQVDVKRFYDAWEADEHYADHETGTIDFAAYSSRLSERFGIELPIEDWQAGWNNLWTDPFHEVIALLPSIRTQYELFAFSNTNPTHEAHFRERYAVELASFNTVFTSSTLGQRKPHPQAYQSVCEQIGVAPTEVIFLDDHPGNIDGARQAGLSAHHCVDQSAVVEVLQRLL